MDEREFPFPKMLTVPITRRHAIFGSLLTAASLASGCSFRNEPNQSEPTVLPPEIGTHGLESVNPEDVDIFTASTIVLNGAYIGRGVLSVNPDNHTQTWLTTIGHISDGKPSVTVCYGDPPNTLFEISADRFCPVGEGDSTRIVGLKPEETQSLSVAYNCSVPPIVRQRRHPNLVPNATLLVPAMTGHDWIVFTLDGIDEQFLFVTVQNPLSSQQLGLGVRGACPQPGLSGSAAYIAETNGVLRSGDGTIPMVGVLQSKYLNEVIQANDRVCNLSLKLKRVEEMN